MKQVARRGGFRQNGRQGNSFFPSPYVPPGPPPGGFGFSEGRPLLRPLGGLGTHALNQGADVFGTVHLDARTEGYGPGELSGIYPLIPPCFLYGDELQYITQAHEAGFRQDGNVL